MQSLSLLKLINLYSMVLGIDLSRLKFPVGLNQVLILSWEVTYSYMNKCQSG